MDSNDTSASLNQMAIAEFIQRWQGSEGHETATSQSYHGDLMRALDLPQPIPAGKPGAKEYGYESRLKFQKGGDQDTTKFADLYKRDCLMLEAKQADNEGGRKRGSRAWRRYLDDAFGQARGYAQNLPSGVKSPPFIIVSDIGYCFEIYATFSKDGRGYQPFEPEALGSYRIGIEDLARPEVQDLFRTIWLDPYSLDPSLKREKATREISEDLAKIASALEADGHKRQLVSEFLMRCIFTMYAEDAELLEPEAFTQLLEDHKDQPDVLVGMLEALWAEMDSGTKFSPIIKKSVRHFNGGLFKDQTALALTQDHTRLLIKAAKSDWRNVEPAIFGTLLERALDPKERHKLGAHYTPRAYVERLIQPTIMEPLEADWDAVLFEVRGLEEADKTQEAIDKVRLFHGSLCATRVLDPACGTGNFLYIALEKVKQLEARVLKKLVDLGETQTISEDVSPKHFLGLELNPQAVWIADVVIWIGYLQWHIKARGIDGVPDPVLKAYGNIKQCDAVLDYKPADLKPLLDDQGQADTRWDRETFKTDPVTGRQIPDETARVQDFQILKAKPTVWPEVEFIVGNPPFLGGKDLRQDLGGGYAERLWSTYKDMPGGADLVMYWWLKASQSLGAKKTKLRRFGFITTNSITQTFNRRVVQAGLNMGLSIIYAIPDHPWVDSSDGAAVRIGMTVAESRDTVGRLRLVNTETRALDRYQGFDVSFDEGLGKIWANLKIGANLSLAQPLLANSNICSPGVKLHGSGFILQDDEARSLLAANPKLRDVIHPYVNGRDLAQKSRNAWVIDLFGLTAEQARDLYPEAYQIVFDRVKPERDENNAPERKANWWLFGRSNEVLRNFLNGLPRYISTIETSKHRFFVFMDASVRPDNKLVNIGLADFEVMAAISSKIHITWSLARGAQLGPTPVYPKSECFDKFPFPDPQGPEGEAIKAKLHEAGERLDAFRKERQAQHNDLTLTGMYNVLEAIKQGCELTDKERDIYAKGAIQVLREIHQEIDDLTADAYGWPRDLSEQEILQRLVDLNQERVAEERKGKIRWLRPDFQDPNYEKPADKAMEVQALDLANQDLPVVEPQAWPKGEFERFAAIRLTLTSADVPLSADQVAASFKRAQRKTVADLLARMSTMGFAQEQEPGRYAA